MFISGYRSKEGDTSLNLSDQLLHVVGNQRLHVVSSQLLHVVRVVRQPFSRNAVIILDAPTVSQTLSQDTVLKGKPGQHDDQEDQRQVSAKVERQAYLQHWRSALTEGVTDKYLGQRVLVLFTTTGGDRHDGQVQAIRRNHHIGNWVNTRVQLVKLEQADPIL